MYYSPFPFAICTFYCHVSSFFLDACDPDPLPNPTIGTFDHAPIFFAQTRGILPKGEEDISV